MHRVRLSSRLTWFCKLAVPVALVCAALMFAALSYAGRWPWWASLAIAALSLYGAGEWGRIKEVLLEEENLVIVGWFSEETIPEHELVRYERGDPRRMIWVLDFGKRRYSFLSPTFFTEKTAGHLDAILTRGPGRTAG